MLTQIFEFTVTTSLSNRKNKSGELIIYKGKYVTKAFQESDWWGFKSEFSYLSPSKYTIVFSILRRNLIEWVLLKEHK